MAPNPSLPPHEGPSALGSLRAGLVAGALIGLADVVVFARDAGDVRTWLAILAIDVATGVVSALALRAVLSLGDWVAALPPGSPRARVDAVLAALASVPLGMELFSGAGVKRTFLGAAGPLVFPVVTAAVAWVSSTVARRARSGRVARASAALGLAAFLADRTWLRGGYFYLHVLAVLVGCAAVGASLAPALARESRRSAPWLVAAAVVGFVFTVAVVRFPHDNRARRLLAEREPFASRIVGALVRTVDLDSDRASPLFGGGDCDDLDAAIGPFRPEIPGNGVDEDCDLRDEPPSDSASLRARSARRAYVGDAARATHVASLATGRPTVVLVVDALRADRADRPGLPALSRLAREAVCFDRAYAPASSTALSIPSMITGVPAPTARTPSVFERLSRVGVPSGLVTIDVVREAISGEIASPATRNYPLTRGVRDVDLVRTTHDQNLAGSGVRESTDAAVTDRAFAMLDGPNAPRLLWVHYFDLHQWEHLREVSGRGVERYDAVLRRVDAQVARWLVRAGSINLVLVADHGEGLGAHGVSTHTRVLFRELVRVPLCIRVPGLEPSRVRTAVSTTDLAPTLLTLVGEGRFAPDPFDLSTLVGELAPTDSELVSFDSQQSSLLDGRYRLVVDLRSRATWLFDETDDPEETEDRSDELPRVRDRMLRSLSRFPSRLR